MSDSLGNILTAPHDSGNNITRTALDFLIDLGDIVSDDAKAQHDRAADQKKHEKRLEYFKKRREKKQEAGGN